MLKPHLYKPQPLVLPQHHEDGKDRDVNDLLWTGKPRNEEWDKANAVGVTQSPKSQSSSPPHGKNICIVFFNVWECLSNEERNPPLASFPLERDLPSAVGRTKNH